jgi:hypothetical protein
MQFPEFTVPLRGMFTSFGNIKKNKNVLEILGINDFHIIPRLDRTINKIIKLK